MPSAPHITKAFQWDLARQVERLDFLLKLLPRYAEWGYRELYVHLEDSVEYPSLPGVARPDAYSHREFASLVDAATKVGIAVVPIVNLLGHTQYLIKTPELRDLNELRDDAGDPLAFGQICPLHPRTLRVAAMLLRDIAPFCTAGKVHVGLDESFQLGKCPRCQADIERRGLAAHFAGHAGQLHRLTAGLGLRMGMWADMLALLPAAIPLLPHDVIAYDWYYYPFARHPRVELRNFAEVDLAAPLQKRGIEYWGCPMNGAFRFEPLPVFGDRLANIVSWWKRCRRVGAGGFLVTSWEANRLAFELTTVVDAAAACLWLNPEIEEPEEMLARGFARMFEARSTRIRSRERQRVVSRSVLGSSVRPAQGPELVDGLALAVTSQPKLLPEQSKMNSGAGVGWGRLARAALAGDDYAFSGYHRWQINERWDVCAERDGVAKYEQEERKLTEICRRLSIPTKIAKPPQVVLADRRDGRDGPPSFAKASAGMPGRPSCSARPAVAPYQKRQMGMSGSIDAVIRNRGPHQAIADIEHDSCPPALAASLAFRLYLAKRDVFVRRAAEGVFNLRRLLNDRVAASVNEWGKQDRGAGKPRRRESLRQVKRFGVSSNRAGSPFAGNHVPAIATKVASCNLHESDLAIARSFAAGLQREASAFAKALRAGRAAARAMWRLSRDPRVCGPNEHILERDAERLREWREWLGSAARNPDLVWQATPVCGAWQLQFTVHNFAPALQKVVVEQQQPDGRWKLLHAVHLIEFRSFAAQPHTKISREISIPMAISAQSSTAHEGGETTTPCSEKAERLKAEILKPKAGFAVSLFPDLPILFGHLRLAVHGVGLVAVSDIELTDGTTHIRSLGRPQAARRIIGRPALQRGFPKLDLKRITGAIEIRFGH